MGCRNSKVVVDGVKPDPGHKKALITDIPEGLRINITDAMSPTPQLQTQFTEIALSESSSDHNSIATPTDLVHQLEVMRADDEEAEAQTQEVIILNNLVVIHTAM
eukprot:GHVH01002980.1.p1 GENE.GHVH01002980.1~~GHVH01002980.1.p1  ORF type:complete len:105 (+),score=20.63 GHVH01002980.1:64-378(+)